MAKEVWGISRLEDNPPRRVPYYPIDESKEFITNYCLAVNEGHARAETKWVFKVFKIEQ